MTDISNAGVDGDDSDSFEQAIALASSLTITYDDVSCMTEAERLGHLVELTGQVIRDPAQENTLLPIVASAAMQWAGDVVEGSDPPHWARHTARQGSGDTQATRFGRASHLTASVAHLAEIIADNAAYFADRLGSALINVAAAALAWLADNIRAGADIDVPRPAGDDYLARISEEILTVLERQNLEMRDIRHIDPFALPDLAEAITDHLDMGGWLTPHLPADTRTKEHTE